MAVRRRHVGDDRAVQFFTEACDDSFTASFFDDPFFASQDHARRAWPEARAAVWATTDRGRIPQAAVVFDGLTIEGPHLIWRAFSQTVFPLPEILKALTRDRAAVAAFAHRDPRGAATVGHFLTLWRTELDHCEAIARELAVTRYGGAIHRLSTPGTYGGDDATAAG